MQLKWFKMNADFCNDSRVIFVESKKNGGMILYHFLKLQCMAAKSNRDGGIFISENLPHTPKTLANEWHLHKSTTENIIKTLEEAELLDIIDGVIFIADWDKIQSVDKLEDIRKSNRERQKRHREKCKNITLQSRYSNGTEEEKEIEKEIELDGDGDIIKEITDSFNATTATKKIKILSSEQKVAIMEAVKAFGVEQIKECFAVASKADFLQGKNPKGWVANFDWLIKSANIAKVLNGNYDLLFKEQESEQICSSFSNDEFISSALMRGFNDL